MAPHSSIRAGECRGQETGGLPPLESQSVGHDCTASTAQGELLLLSIFIREKVEN